MWWSCSTLGSGSTLALEGKAVVMHTDISLQFKKADSIHTVKHSCSKSVLSLKVTLTMVFATLLLWCGPSTATTFSSL